jgi:hypothetical protein
VWIIDGLKVMTVRVNHECSVVGVSILWARSGSAVIASAIGAGSIMECVNIGDAVSGERKVKTGFCEVNLVDKSALVVTHPKSSVTLSKYCRAQQYSQV